MYTTTVSTINIGTYKYYLGYSNIQNDINDHLQNLQSSINYNLKTINKIIHE